MLMAKLLLVPVVLNVMLVILIGIAMGRARTAAVMAGKVKLADVALDNSRWPENVRKLGNAYQNQFEQPVLFYFGVVLILIFGLADWPSLIIASLYVAARYAHAFVHTGSNIVMLRFRFFLFSMAALGLLWIWFGIRVVTL